MLVLHSKFDSIVLHGMLSYRIWGMGFGHSKQIGRQLSIQADDYRLQVLSNRVSGMLKMALNRCVQYFSLVQCCFSDVSIDSIQL